MTAEEFYLQEDCANSENYDIDGIEYWYYGSNAMIKFAEAYAEQKNKQLIAALELALEALEDAHLMGDFSDDIEAIKEVLNKEK